MASNGKKGILSGMIWSFSERIAAQLVSTVVSIILARLLTPDHYGIISMVTVFTSVCNVFVTSGFGSSVVQKKDADDLDFDTAFWLSFSMSVVLFAGLYLAAPWIADFYAVPQLKWVVRIMGIRLLIASLETMHQAYMRRQMAFRKFFVSTLSGTLISGVVGVVMAYGGAGVWALVAQYLTNGMIATAVLHFVSGWRPKLRFSAHRAKAIFSFGWKVLATDLIATLETDIRSLVVGKVFSLADLAYYDQGKKYPSLIVTNINSSLTKVLLPAYAREQEHLEEVKRLLRSTARTGMFLLTPLLFGFAVVAETFVEVVLTDTWMPTVPYIRIFCLVFLLRPLETVCNQAVLAIGKSDVTLKIMTVINVTALATVMVGAFLFRSVLAIALGSLLTALVSVICFANAARVHIGYRWIELIQDMIGSIAAGAIMAGAVFLIGKLPVTGILLLIPQIGVGAVVYVLTAHILKLQAYEVMLGQVKKKLKKK